MTKTQTQGFIYLFILFLSYFTLGGRGAQGGQEQWAGESKQ